MIRCFVKGAPDQLLARAATVFDSDAGPSPADGRVRELYLAENRRLAAKAVTAVRPVPPPAVPAYPGRESRRERP